MIQHPDPDKNTNNPKNIIVDIVFASEQHLCHAKSGTDPLQPDKIHKKLLHCDQLKCME